jgi:uncharacterized cupredoxin-like copper-binding protein
MEEWAMRTRRVLAVIATLSLGVGACSSTGATASPAAPSTASGTAVKVTLQEWAVSADVTTAPAGAVTFTATNNGPEDIHEFVVIKTDLSLTELPTDATGAVDEAGGNMTVSGEIEDIAVGASGDLVLTLEPGAYVLICNIYDEAEKEAHYQLGMRASFTVQ